MAFRLLPSRERRAMNALYAFLRVTDDLSDVPGKISGKRARLAEWRMGFTAALHGEFTHPVHPALAETIRRYEIPPRHLFNVIDGVEMDLESVRFASFAELYPYCYRVASAVGLACVHVWGLRPGVSFEAAEGPAEAAGIAFQLTNILRDLKEDLDRGRIYLPIDELERFDIAPDSWRRAPASPSFDKLLDFQVERAREFFRKSESLCPLLSSNGCGIFYVMSETYRQLLQSISRAGFAILARRVSVPSWRKGSILMGGWMRRFGCV